MKALILAAGYGTRLRPITDSMPKALVPVAGVPMLERVIRKLVDAGIEEIVVNTHYFSDQVRDFLKDNGNFGCRISISGEEDGILDTGGAIRHASPLLGACGSILVHNVDILSDIPVEWLAASHRPDCLATLAVRDAEADRYLLFDDDMRLVGWTNVRTGEVKSPYPGLDPGSCRKYSFCGIHILSDEALTLMEDWPEKFSIIDFYLAMAATHPIYGAVAQGCHLIDIGTPEKLAQAQEAIGRLAKSK